MSLLASFAFPAVSRPLVSLSISSYRQPGDTMGTTPRRQRRNVKLMYSPKFARTKRADRGWSGNAWRSSPKFPSVFVPIWHPLCFTSWPLRESSRLRRPALVSSYSWRLLRVIGDSAVLQVFVLQASMISLLIFLTVHRPCRIGQRVLRTRPAGLVALPTFFPDGSSYFVAPTLLAPRVAACYQPERRHT